MTISSLWKRQFTQTSRNDWSWAQYKSYFHSPCLYQLRQVDRHYQIKTYCETLKIVWGYKRIKAARMPAYLFVFWLQEVETAYVPTKVWMQFVKYATVYCRVLICCFTLRMIGVGEQICPTVASDNYGGSVETQYGNRNTYWVSENQVDHILKPFMSNRPI